LQTIKN